MRFNYSPHSSPMKQTNHTDRFTICSVFFSSCNNSENTIKLPLSDTFAPWRDRGMDTAVWRNQARDLLGKPGSRKGLTNTLSSLRISTGVPLSNTSLSWLMKLLSRHGFPTISQIHKTDQAFKVVCCQQYRNSLSVPWVALSVFNILFSCHYEPVMRLKQPSIYIIVL